MKSYGVLETEPVGDELSIHVEEVRNIGYTTIASGLNENELKVIRENCLSTSELYKNLYSKYNLSSIGEENSFRCPALIDLDFLKIPSNIKLIEIVSRLITGEFFLNQQNLVVNPPKSNSYTQLKFHRDLPYQHYVSTRPLAINALFAVDDFTIQNGGTYVIPGSHKTERFPTDAYLESQQKQISVKAGTFLVLDCMVYHAAAPNLSENPRIGINHVFSTVMFRPQIDWQQAFLDSKVLGWEKYESLLGLQFSTPKNVESYLLSRSLNK